MPPRYTFFGQQKAGYRKPTLARCEKKLLVHAHFCFFFVKRSEFLFRAAVIGISNHFKLRIGLLDREFLHFVQFLDYF